MALIKNNAKIAAQIAVELAKLQSDDNIFTTPCLKTTTNTKSNPVVVIGGSILDIHYSIHEDSLEVSSSKAFFNYFLGYKKVQNMFMCVGKCREDKMCSV